MKEFSVISKEAVGDDVMKPGQRRVSFHISAVVFPLLLLSLRGN